MLRGNQMLPNIRERFNENAIVRKGFNVNQRVILFILLAGILPVVNLFGFQLPSQYVFIPFFAVLVFLYWKDTPKVAKYLMYLWAGIITEATFTGIFSPVVMLGRFNVPTEIAPYIAEALFFGTFILFFYHFNLDSKWFLNMLIGVLLLGMGIGVLQFFDWFGSDVFRRLYSFSDYHYEYMNREVMSHRRITGVAHFATATGGIAAFTLVLILSKHLFHQKKLWLLSIGTILTLFNVITAQARMGLATIVFAGIVFYFVYNLVYEKWLKSTILASSLLIGVAGVVFLLYQAGNAFVGRAVYRWQALGEQIQSGGNRIGQIKEALSLLNHPFEYIFGIARGGQQAIEGLHIEVEPVNILVLYGAIGFVLQYGIIVFLLVYLFKNIKLVKAQPVLLTLTIASFVTLLSYQFFSIAYFFFREIHVGLFPWILLGATIGAIERFKKEVQYQELVK